VSSSLCRCCRFLLLWFVDVVVHRSSDFENKFVCGEIMSHDDLKEYGSEAAVKAAGKLRQQGKPYESMFFSLFPFV
jgi:Protein of unknown function (DUF933)